MVVSKKIGKAGPAAATATIVVMGQPTHSGGGGIEMQREDQKETKQDRAKQSVTYVEIERASVADVIDDTAGRGNDNVGVVQKRSGLHRLAEATHHQTDFDVCHVFGER